MGIKVKKRETHNGNAMPMSKDNGVCIDPEGCQDKRCPGGENCLWSCGWANCRKCKANGTVNTGHNYTIYDGKQNHKYKE